MIDFNRLNPFINGGEPRPETTNSVRKWVWLFITLFGISFCLTTLYTASREVMRLGGMVARGGPYEIAHPAPDWVWIVPVSILLGIALVFLNMFTVRDVGLNFLAFAWPALFLSLGWNFFEFGFRPPGGEGVVWGWLICGVVFALMGGIPLIIALRAAWPYLPEAVSRAGAKQIYPILFQLIAVISGVYCGELFFKTIS